MACTSINHRGHTKDLTRTQIEAIAAVIPDSGIYPPIQQQTQQPYQQYGKIQAQQIYQPPSLQQQTPQQQQTQQQKQQTPPHQQTYQPQQQQVQQQQTPQQQTYQ